MADTETPVAEVAAGVPETVNIERACVGTAQGESLKMLESGAGLITVEGRAELSQSGSAALIGNDEIELFQSGAVLAVADRVDVKQGFVGILVASEASFEQDSKVLITGQNAILLGAVCAVVFGAVVAIGDYFVRGMFHD
jgi:hypothetical protein